MMQHGKNRFKTLRLGLYETIAFMTGFVLMAYELVAARLLAPSIGTSTYVWTSVIGTMIAALALGYAAGGWLADKRTLKQDVAALLLASCVAVTGTLLFYNGTVGLIVSAASDPRLQGVLAALLLFMPASFLLGMISPYLVRLRTKSIETTGRSVAGLSALNSLGGITGTFATGFMFFAWIGLRETLALLVVILLACSWTIMPTYRLAQRLALSIGIAFLLVMQLAAPVRAGIIASIDTPTAHYEVADTTYGQASVRVLMTGPYGYQSGVYTSGLRYLAFEYTARMAEVVTAAPKRDKILILGGGAFTLPDFLAHTYPKSQIDVVEIDPKLADIAKEHFFYSSPPNVRVIAEDARTYVNHAKGAYDIVLVDVYSDSFIPFSLTTQEYTTALKRLSGTSGVVAANIIGSTGPRCIGFLSSLHQSYAHAYQKSMLLPVRSAYVMQRQNLVALYSDAELSWAKDLKNAQPVHLPAGRELTDNYAPVEPLTRQCNGLHE